MGQQKKMRRQAQLRKLKEKQKGMIKVTDQFGKLIGWKAKESAYSTTKREEEE